MPQLDFHVAYANFLFLILFFIFFYVFLYAAFLRLLLKIFLTYLYIVERIDKFMKSVEDLQDK